MRHPLWPDSERSSDANARRYLVVPSVDDPRLVVPTRPHKAADAIVRALRDRSSPRTRVQNTVLRLAGRANLRSVALPDPPLFADISRNLGGDRDRYVFGVHLGPPRANRKPVLAVSERSGQLVAFAKCGVNSLTDALVSHEAEALSQLRDLVSTQVPELIASGHRDGHPYVLQTPVPTHPRRRDPDVVAAAQVEVAASGQPRVNVDTALDATAAQWASRQSSSGGEIVDRFATIAASWRDQMRATSLAWGSWHGDWRSTNMAVTDRGCSVWDWERYASGVPVGYDALHLFLTTRASSVHDLTTLPNDLRDNAARLLRPFAVVDRRDVELVTTGYLLELAGRYLDDDQARSGARLGNVQGWLLPHLQSAAQSSAAQSSKRSAPGVTDH